MANRRIEVDIVANDRASNVFSQVRSTASSMSSTLMTKLGGTVNAVGNLEKGLRNYNNSMYRFNRIASNVFRVAGKSIADFTKDAINNFSELERQHAKTMGAMATEYDKTAEAQAKFLRDSEKLKQQALNLGTYGVNGKGSLNTVTDVAYAQTALVKAGVVKDNNVDQLINSGAVESILKFAGGNDLDVDTATTFAVNLATVFNKPLEEWGTMLDQVTKAADISVIDVPDIMDSLTYTGGIASGLKRDLEEVLGVISVMGQAGLRGRVAGTGLQAFFTRILSSGELSDTQIGNAPTNYAGQIYNAFIGEATKDDGTFRSMDEVASLLDTAMGSLNDQEQAWFAKKLFGLYQMKAAYALTGSVDGDQNLITDFIGQITNQSGGANTVKYELMQASQYGKIASIQNVWGGIKTDFGDRLSPVVSTVADELLAFFSNSGNYEINWDKLRDAFAESGDEITERYGEEIAEFVEELGNLGIDAIEITDANLPLLGGIASGITKLLGGDVSGALSDFYDGLSNTNTEIDDLPPELKGVAEGARNVIIAFTALTGINLITTIGETIAKAIKGVNWVFGKISTAVAKITGTKTTVSSATSSVNTTSTTINTGSVNIGSVPLMNVTATVVNVYGGGSNPNPNTNPTNPTNHTTPTLPYTPIVPTLPVVPGSNSPFLLPGTPLLPGGTDLSTKGAINMYKFGGKYMTSGQIASIVGKAGLAATSTAMVLSLGGSEAKGIKAEREGTDVAKQEMYDYWNTEKGAKEALDEIKTELKTNGELTEQFFNELISYKGSNGATYKGNQKDAEYLFGILFGGTYKAPWIHGGGFANKSLSEFAQNAIDKDLVNKFDNIALNINDAMNGMNNMIDKIQSPNVNVNVTTTVDKSGYANTKVDVDVDKVSKSISRKASRYGTVAMNA